VNFGAGDSAQQDAAEVAPADEQPAEPQAPAEVPQPTEAQQAASEEAAAEQAQSEQADAQQEGSSSSYDSGYSYGYQPTVNFGSGDQAQPAQAQSEQAQPEQPAEAEPQEQQAAPDLPALARRALDPSASAEELEPMKEHRELWPYLATAPSASPELLDWLAQTDDPTVLAYLRNRGHQA
jgi:hypothetical protein